MRSGPRVSRTCSTTRRRLAGLRSFPRLPREEWPCPVPPRTPTSSNGYSPVPALSDALPDRSGCPRTPSARVVRVVRHTNLTTCLGHIPARRQQNLRFTKLLNDLFGPESFTWHSLPPVLEPKPEFATPELVAVKGGQVSQCLCMQLIPVPVAFPYWTVRMPARLRQTERRSTQYGSHRLR